MREPMVVGDVLEVVPHASPNAESVDWPRGDLKQRRDVLSKPAPRGELHPFVLVLRRDRQPPAGLVGKAGASVSDNNDDVNDINVLLTGKRLQITADVDAAGIKRLKQMLTKYEEILKLLSQPIENFKRPETDTSSDETE